MKITPFIPTGYTMNRIFIVIFCFFALPGQFTSLFAQVASSPGLESEFSTEDNPNSDSQTANSFRINNKVFVGKETSPTSQSCTMFYSGRVYDFMTNPEETIIFDAEMKRFLIISSQTKTQCSITLEEVDSFEQMMKDAAEKVKDEFIKSCLKPAFEITQDSKTDEWVYTAPRLVYRIKASAEPAPGMAAAYAEFANKYALLNVILMPQTMPPFARMAVNNDLAKKGLLPEKIEITIQPQIKPLSLNFGKEKIHTTHNFVQGLGDGDLTRIRKAGENFGRFKPVSFDKYQKLLSKKATK